MATVDKIMAISREVFDDSDVHPSARIMELKGFDSLRHVQFVIELESNLNITIDAEKVPPDATITEIAANVDGMRS